MKSLNNYKPLPTRYFYNATDIYSWMPVIILPHMSFSTHFCRIIKLTHACDRRCSGTEYKFNCR